MTDNNTPPSGSLEPPSEIGNPTTQMPAAAPGGPGNPGLPPTGFDGPDEYDLPDPAPRSKAPLIAAGVVAVLAIGGVIAALVLGGGDDDTLVSDSVVVTESTSTVVDTTVPEVTTTIPETTVVETTTTVAPETTTTVAPTTAPPSTVAPTSAPPATAPATTIPVVTVPPAPETTLWDVIANSPDLSQFKAAVEAAGLVDLLDGPEPVTVFIPSNAAIEAFNAGVGNEGLIDDPDFLRHHIVNGLFTSADVLAATELTTAAGDTIAVDAAAATVDGARLVVIDVQVGGSVLHVVDKVLVVSA